MIHITTHIIKIIYYYRYKLCTVRVTRSCDNLTIKIASCKLYFTLYTKSNIYNGSNPISYILHHLDFFLITNMIVCYLLPCLFILKFKLLK